MLTVYLAFLVMKQQQKYEKTAQPHGPLHHIMPGNDRVVTLWMTEYKCLNWNTEELEQHLQSHVLRHVDSMLRIINDFSVT